MPDDLGYLLGELAGLMVLAGLFGLLSGWLIFGGRPRPLVTENADVASMQSALERAEISARHSEDRVAALTAELAALRGDERGAVDDQVALPDGKDLSVALKQIKPEDPPKFTQSEFGASPWAMARSQSGSSVFAAAIPTTPTVAPEPESERREIAARSKQTPPPPPPPDWKAEIPGGDAESDVRLESTEKNEQTEGRDTPDQMGAGKLIEDETVNESAPDEHPIDTDHSNKTVENLGIDPKPDESESPGDAHSAADDVSPDSPPEMVDQGGFHIRPSRPLSEKSDLSGKPPSWQYEGDPYGGDILDRDYDGDGVVGGRNEGKKPPMRAAPRAGGPDNLQLIRGIGPKIEALCNKMGLYHLEQIADWSDDECAWMDANLTGYRGRPSRDQWIAQAQELLKTHSVRH